jgi:sugar porter (SP) family MFS transporter
LGGLAIGVSTIAAPAYISEISPSKDRGKLVGLFQINIVVGILAAFISNYFLEGFGDKNDWRWMLGAEVLPALIFLALILNIPESPRWLVLKKGQTERAFLILKSLYNGSSQTAEKVLHRIKNESSNHRSSGVSGNKTRISFLLAFLMAFFNQTSGINFILYYAPEIMEKAGLATGESLLGAVFLGGTNLCFTLWGLALIDRMVRKHLMLIGSVGYLLSLGMVIYGFYHQISPVFNLLGMLLFIAAHAIGQGTVIWVFISEIFPNHLRAKGQSFGALIHWGMAAMITLTGSVLISSLAAWQIFLVFLICMFMQAFFVIFFMPETKGKPLEEEHPDTVSQTAIQQIYLK